MNPNDSLEETRAAWRRLHPETNWQPVWDDGKPLGSHFTPPVRKPSRGGGLVMVVLGILVALGFVAAGAYTFNLGPFANDGGGSTPILSRLPSSQPGIKPVEQAPKMDCASVLGKGTPCRVRVGRPFVYESATMQVGWKVFRSQYGSNFSIVGSVKNTGRYPHGTWLAFKFFNNSKGVGALLCYTGTMRPGDTAALNCIDNGKFGEYDRITVETAS